MKKIYISGLLLLTIFLAGCGHSARTVYVFEGPSMASTIQDEDRFAVNKAYYDKHEVQRGEIVLYEAEPNKLHVKCILGLSGERIQMGSGQLLVDGEPVNEEFIFQEITYEGLDITLEDIEHFILGDAMDMSQDSRHIGPIMGENIIGKVIKVKSK